MGVRPKGRVRLLRVRLIGLSVFFLRRRHRRKKTLAQALTGQGRSSSCKIWEAYIQSHVNETFPYTSILLPNGFSGLDGRALALWKTGNLELPVFSGRQPCRSISHRLQTRRRYLQTDDSGKTRGAEHAERSERIYRALSFLPWFLRGASLPCSSALEASRACRIR